MREDELTKMVYDALVAKYSLKDLQDPKKYDEILTYIVSAFDEATMMKYINAGFYRPVAK